MMISGVYTNSTMHHKHDKDVVIWGNTTISTRRKVLRFGISLKRIFRSLENTDAFELNTRIYIVLLVPKKKRMKMDKIQSNRRNLKRRAEECQHRSPGVRFYGCGIDSMPTSLCDCFTFKCCVHWCNINLPAVYRNLEENSSMHKASWHI